MSSEFNASNYSSKMDKRIQSLKKDISTLRTEGKHKYVRYN